MKKFAIAAVAAILATVAVAPAAQAAPRYKSEERAEQYFESEYADFYEEDGYEFYGVWCEGRGHSIERGDEELFRKFRCESNYTAEDSYDDEDYDDEDYDEDYDEDSGDDEIDDVDMLYVRGASFKLRSISSTS